MTEQSLSTDPFVRRTAVVAAVIALVIVLAGAVAFLLTRGEAQRQHDVEIGLVAPTDANRVAMGLVECPATDRADAPLADSDFASSQLPVERTGFGGGQVVAYNLRIRANDAQADPARFVLRFSNAFEPGIRCAFIVDDDPDTVDADTVDAESVELTWQDAGGSEPTGQIEVAGLSSGDTIVAQVWVVVRADDEPGRQMRLTVAPGVGTDAESTTRSDRVSLGFPTTAVGDPTITIDDGELAAQLGGEHTTRFTATNDTNAVMNSVRLTASIDDGASVAGARVSDSVGHPTSCRTRRGDLVCDLGFLNPGESVAIVAAVAIDDSAVSFWGRSEGTCLNDDQQDVCQRATLEWIGPFSSDSTSNSEVTNVDDSTVFSVEAISSADVGYRLGSVAVNILVTTDGVAAELTEVSTSGCPTATYIGGDTDQGSAVADPAFATDGDGAVNSGELWIFSCAARQYDEGVIEVVVAGIGDGVPGRTVDTVEIDVIDPMIEISRIEGTEVTWTVTNPGDVPLTSPAVSAPGCEPQRVDNGDGDASLDVDERWQYTCPAGAGTGRVFAVDPLGATVSAIDETGDDGT